MVKRIILYLNFIGINSSFMDILILSRGIPTKDNPVWGNFEFEQAQALRNMGHKVVVASVDARTRFHKQKIGITRLLVDNIETYTIYIPFPYYFLPIKVKDFLLNRIALLLFQSIKNEWGKPDIIHAHYLVNIGIAVTIGEKYNIPVVGTEHWSKVGAEIISDSVLYLGNKYYSRVNQLISVSESLRKNININFGVDSIVLDNMCAVDIFQYQPSLQECNDDTFRLLSVGRLDKNKGFEILIEAFAKASKELPTNLKLDIIGSGYLTNKLLKTIRKYGMQKTVRLLGRKSKYEIAEEMRRSDAFILTSRAETFGVAYIEALAAGLPVIATRVGSTSQFITEKTGVLVDVDNVEQTVSAIKNIFYNKKKYNSYEISMFCIERYSPTVIMNELLNIYKKCMV